MPTAQVADGAETHLSERDVVRQTVTGKRFHAIRPTPWARERLAAIPRERNRGRLCRNEKSPRLEAAERRRAPPREHPSQKALSRPVAATTESGASTTKTSFESEAAPTAKNAGHHHERERRRRREARTASQHVHAKPRDGERLRVKRKPREPNGAKTRHAERHFRTASTQKRRPPSARAERATSFAALPRSRDPPLGERQNDIGNRLRRLERKGQRLRQLLTAARTELFSTSWVSS